MIGHYNRQQHAFSPGIARLEDRTLNSTGISVLSVVPNVLIPPKGQTIQVTVQGNVTESSAKVKPIVRYLVVDQYHVYEPHGRIVHLIPINPNAYRYIVKIPLQASRSTKNGPNAYGRQYSILLTSQDADNSAAVYAGAVVPLNPSRPPKPIHVLPGV